MHVPISTVYTALPESVPQVMDLLLILLNLQPQKESQESTNKCTLTFFRRQCNEKYILNLPRRRFAPSNRIIDGIAASLSYIIRFHLQKGNVKEG